MGATSNFSGSFNTLAYDDLNAVFEELQDWEEILSASGFEPEELQP